MKKTTKQRNTKTLSKIQSVFIQLLKEKGFDNLTVSDISRLAGINRGTFYLHYEDKYDLLNSMLQETIVTIENILNQPLASNSLLKGDELVPYDALLEVMEYVLEHRDFIEAMVSSNSNDFINKLQETIESVVNYQLNNTTVHFNQIGIPDDYAREILLGSVVSIILLWIKKGFVEEPEQITDMICNTKLLSASALLS